jgi:hypothetical protein
MADRAMEDVDECKEVLDGLRATQTPTPALLEPPAMQQTAATDGSEFLAGEFQAPAATSEQVPTVQLQSGHPTLGAATILPPCHPPCCACAKGSDCSTGESVVAVRRAWHALAVYLIRSARTDAATEKTLLWQMHIRGH